jgi:hypothetical protein
MEPVETCEPVDLDCDPRSEKGAETYGHLASVSMSREGRDSSRETAQTVHSEENDARNQEGGEGRFLKQLKRYSKTFATWVQR